MGNILTRTDATSSSITSSSTDSTPITTPETTPEVTEIIRDTQISTFDVNDPRTANGAISYSTVGSPLVQLFFKSVRDIPHTEYNAAKPSTDSQSAKSLGITSKSLEEYFEAAWSADKTRTLKFIFYLRDCRNGKGEKSLFRALIQHCLTTGKVDEVLRNMKHIPSFGSWKDIACCFYGTPYQSTALELTAAKLQEDLTAERPSLCAKYAPTEGGAFDRKYHVARDLCKILGISSRNYRTKYLVPLRSKLNIVERSMCSGQWSKISYSTVPSIAGKNYKNAFVRHDGERYKEYLGKVIVGEAKMNTAVLMPHQIVSPYLHKYDVSEDKTIEAQWKSFLDTRRSKWPAHLNVMPIVDVSGSMYGGMNPVDVAVSMGLLVAALNTSPKYKNCFITFSSTPTIERVPEGTLCEQVAFLKKAQWGMTTNLQAVFDLLLNTATLFAVPQAEMPQIVLILSDMQFDEATLEHSTNFEAIESKYSAAGYSRPMIVFWNLLGASEDFPVPSATVPNCLLLSGYSDSVMYDLLDLKLPDPTAAVYAALDNSRYDVLTI